MNVQTESPITLPRLAPTQYRVSGSIAIDPTPVAIVEDPIVRPSSLGLIDEFEQEAA